jgi:hypothetical protein
MTTEQEMSWEEWLQKASDFLDYLEQQILL